MIRATLIAAVALLASACAGRSFFDSENPAADRWRYEFHRSYGEELRAAGEEPLHPTGLPDRETLRCSLFSFGHPTITVRADRSGAAYRLVAKQLTLYEEPTEIDRQKSRSLESREWDHLVRLIEQADFWEMSSKDPLGIERLDGADWLLEGARADRYHYADRDYIHAMQELPAFVRACLCLTQLSELPAVKNDPDRVDLTAKLDPGCD